MKNPEMTEDDKKALRAQLRQQMWSIDAQELRSRSTHAAERLCATDEFQRAGAVMIFLPLTHEIDARPVAVRAWQMGKTVTVPLVGYEQRHMIPVEIKSLNEPIDADERGVPAPRDASPVPVELIDLVVVPGLGFDLSGHRLGRGGGFYDRFLSQANFEGRTCGYALDEQIVEKVPVAAHDVALDMVVTDRREIRFRRVRKRA